METIIYSDMTELKKSPENTNVTSMKEKTARTYSELSSDGIKAHMDGVLKVRRGGDLRPVLVPVFLPSP